MRESHNFNDSCSFSPPRNGIRRRRKRIEKLVFQTLFEQVNIVLEAIVGIAFAHDLAVCVNDRRMVASSEQGADLRQALVGEFL